MRILITGGAGFIGSNMVKLALAHGIEVTVVDDMSTGYIQNLAGLDILLIEGSVLDRAVMKQALLNVDSVIHLAALGSVPRSIADPMATHACNVTGTLTVLEEARLAGVRHLVLSSSSSVYGMNTALPKRERDWVRPISPYAVSKLAAEQYVLAYQQSFGMETLAFRFFNVYGPGQRAGHPYAAVIPVFVDAVLNDEAITVDGDGYQSRDFTYVGTVCQLLLETVMRRLTHPEPVNLAFGTSTTLAKLIEVIGEATGRTPRVVHSSPRPGDVRHSQANNDLLRSLFSEIQPVSLRQGIEETVSWFGEPK